MAALLISEAMLCRCCKTEDNHVSPKIADIVTSKADDILQGMHTENKKGIVVFSCFDEADRGMLEKMSKIATVYGAEIKLLAAKRSWEEFFIHAKPVLDQADANELNILLPKSEEAKCNELVPFIFNNHTYKVKHVLIDVNDNLDGMTDECNLDHIKKILSELPSSDGLPIKTLKSRIIPAEHFYHGFTTRCGGVSTYPTMKSLSLAMSLKKKDTRVYIEENRKRLAKAEGFQYEMFECASAVHGVDVWIVGEDQPSSYDAIVTNRPGVTIAAPGADCQTLLFCDVNKKVVAAAHAGWKGTIDRIQQNVVKVMTQQFDCNVENIRVCIGPSIGVCCYNVDEERAREFISKVGKCVVEQRNGTFYLDLWKTTVILLEEVGINQKNIDDGKGSNHDEVNGDVKVTQCTQCNKDKFFSYRRDGLLFGNQIGFIGINSLHPVESIIQATL